MAENLPNQKPPVDTSWLFNQALNGSTGFSADSSPTGLQARFGSKRSDNLWDNAVADAKDYVGNYSLMMDVVQQKDW